MFGPYVTGNVVSSCGNWVQQIAAAVLMFQLTRSAFMVGAVSMVLFAGPLLLALWTGVLSDRRDRRRVLMVGRGLTCLAVGVLALLITVQGVDGFGGPPVLLACAAAMGVGHALSLPAMQALGRVSRIFAIRPGRTGMCLIDMICPTSSGRGWSRCCRTGRRAGVAGGWTTGW
jgi:MFS family permease